MIHAVGTHGRAAAGTAPAAASLEENRLLHACTRETFLPYPAPMRTPPSVIWLIDNCKQERSQTSDSTFCITHINICLGKTYSIHMAELKRLETTNHWHETLGLRPAKRY